MVDYGRGPHVEQFKEDVRKGRIDAYFIATESLFLDSEGKLQPKLFRQDKLHLNETDTTAGLSPSNRTSIRCWMVWIEF